MTPKSLALATSDSVRSPHSVRIAEGCAGYRCGQRNAGLAGIAKFEARALRRI
jgi:hypothetical protein